MRCVDYKLLQEERKMKKMTKIGCFLLCTVFFALAALGSGSDSESSSSKAEKAEEISNTGSTESSTEKESNTSTEKGKTEFKVGDTFDYDGLKITYVSSSDYTSDNQFIQPAEGNKFIRLLFHVENQSGTDKSVTSFSFECYADGYNASRTYRDDDLSASLSNGRSSDGAVYYEVPTDAKNIEIEYEYNIISGKKVKFIFEGNEDSGLTFEKNTSSSADAFHVGDIIETKNFRIVYSKASEYVSDNQFLQPAEGKKYIYIELEFENLSSSDHTVSYFSFNCFADGASCDGYYGLDDGLSATLSPGRKAKGTVAFEVPSDAKVIEIEYEDNIWTSNKIIFAYGD